MSVLLQGLDKQLINITHRDPFFFPTKAELPATADRKENAGGASVTDKVDVGSVAANGVNDLAENGVLLLQSGDLFLKITDALRWS